MRVLSIIIATLMAVYFVIAVYYFKEPRQDDPCQRLEVIVTDSLDEHFVSEGDLHYLLKKEKLYPLGKPMNEINTDKIETALLKNEMIAEVEAFKTPSGIVKLEVEQKIPVLRIIGSSGNYYVDNLGTTMPVSNRYAVRVPVATGHIKKEFAKKELYEFALFLEDNEFWNQQIEQIHVAQNGDIELIPRVGNQNIVLGSLTDYKEKLNNLMLFYEQAIPKVGWEKYHTINLKYKNQIVCTKK